MASISIWYMDDYPAVQNVNYQGDAFLFEVDRDQNATVKEYDKDQNIVAKHWFRTPTRIEHLMDDDA